MVRARSWFFRGWKSPFAGLVLGLLCAVTAFVPAARGQPEDGGAGGGGGGGENPPQVDPNSPAERLRVIRESELERIETARETSLERLSNLLGQTRQTIRREADRSIKGVNELAKRANRRLDAFQRQVVRELRNQRATRERIAEFQASVKSARDAIKSAATAAVAEIRTRAQRVIDGQFAEPPSPIPPP